jgi:cyclic pyranopterin phosphate synthase
MQDAFGRKFSYVRLSVTDACNFRCTYCLPYGFQKKVAPEIYLSVPEIKRLTGAFAEMGVWKFRITGGEPTLRPDILEIIGVIAGTVGVQKIALSTNGSRLKMLAKKFLDVGLTHLNVSADSLDPARFDQLTGHDKIKQILEGVDEAIAVGFPWVKINAVLMKEINADPESQKSFKMYVKNRPVTVRFIELMPTGGNQKLFEKSHVRGSSIVNQLTAEGWTAKTRESDDGPAQEFTHPDYRGRIGVIAPYAKDFCTTCNRLRVTSLGALRLCLFGESNASFRHLLGHDDQKEELKKWLLSNVMRKEISHYLPEGRYGNTETFSAMGG